MGSHCPPAPENNSFNYAVISGNFDIQLCSNYLVQMQVPNGFPAGELVLVCNVERIKPRFRPGWRSMRAYMFHTFGLTLNACYKIAYFT